MSNNTNKNIAIDVAYFADVLLLDDGDFNKTQIRDLILNKGVPADSDSFVAIWKFVNKFFAYEKSKNGSNVVDAGSLSSYMRHYSDDIYDSNDDVNSLLDNFKF